MSAKSNKIELSEKFRVIWREEQTLWDVMSPLYQDKNEKDKSFTHPFQSEMTAKIVKNITQDRKSFITQSKLMIF